MGDVQDAIGDALAAEITRRKRWDELPAVFTVYYKGGRGHLRRVPLPGMIWATGPTSRVLERIADATETGGMDALRATAEAGLYGAAFFTEIWMASAPEGTAEEADLLARGRAAGGRVSKLADRVETRSIYAVDRAGITYTALQAWGSAEVQRDVSYPKAGQPAGGAVPAALDRLVKAFLGVSLPDRRQTL